MKEECHCFCQGQECCHCGITEDALRCETDGTHCFCSSSNCCFCGELDIRLSWYDYDSSESNEAPERAYNPETEESL